MEFGVGIEGTFAPQCGKDTLTITGHYQPRQWRHDLQLVRDIGVREFRYPIPWHRIERKRGRYDWRHLDQLIPHAEELGLSIIADPLHHTSHPVWLEKGFADSEFASAYTSLLAAFSRRYPSVKTYVPFNEPTCTLDFCGLRGFWFPYAKGDRSFVSMLRHTARAVAECIHDLRAQSADIHILHVDTFERHAALDAASAERAAFLNERRFLFEELIGGKVNGYHALCEYLLTHGYPERDLEWHLAHPATIHERGGNYYPLSEEQLLEGKTRYAPSKNPVGLAGVVAEYAERLPYPLSLTETNIQGTARDRISWLKYTLEQAEQLEAGGIHLKRFAWYPLFDCAGWNCLLQDRWWKRDPQGLLSCGDDWRRERTEFTEIYRSVVHGARSGAIPAYRFTPRHDATLAALREQMRWEWVEQC